MAHASTIKAEVKKEFGKDLKVVSVETKSFGVLVVKVHKETKRRTKIGLIFGQTNFDLNEKNGIVLDKKIDWL